MKSRHVLILLFLLIHFVSNAQNEKPSEVIIGTDTLKMFPFLFPKDIPVDYMGMDFLFFPDSLSDGNWVQLYVGEDSLVAKKGTYMNHVKHGSFLEYDLSGNLVKHAVYEGGKLIQWSSYYAKGTLKTSKRYSKKGDLLVSEAWFENNTLWVKKGVNLYQEWYADGKKRIEKNYMNQKVDGKVTLWFSTGDLMYVANWSQGQQLGNAEYRKKPNGKVKYVDYRKLPRSVQHMIRGY